MEGRKDTIFREIIAKKFLKLIRDKNLHRMRNPKATQQKGVKTRNKRILCQLHKIANTKRF